ARRARETMTRSATRSGLATGIARLNSWLDARGAQNRGGALEGAQHVRELQAVAYADEQAQLRRLRRGLVAPVDVGDVGLGGADRLRDLRKRALAVLHQDVDRGLEGARERLRPVDAHPALAVAVPQAAADRAVGRVHREALASEVAGDVVAGDRAAT